MANLLPKLQEELIKALKAKDEAAVSTIRFVISKIQNAQIAKGGELTDEEVLSEIAKEAKRHKESIAAFKGAGREELAQKEEGELKILSSYLPQELTGEEIEKIVDDAISEVGAASLADIGKVMSKVMERAKGKADGSTVNQMVKSKLTKS